MDLTTAAVAGETTEKGNVGIISLSHKTLPYWKTPRHAVKYKECLKNHAARLGGHAVDGCGEYLQSPEATPSDPKSLECVACGCHRNFHQAEDDSVSTDAEFVSFRRYPSPIPLPNVLLHQYPIRSEEHGTVVPQGNPNGRKRHRTKFTRDQKEKMLCFSDRLGWKIRKSDEAMVDEFCNEIGVGKGVLKVWMHNNKQSIRKTH